MASSISICKHIENEVFSQLEAMKIDYNDKDSYYEIIIKIINDKINNYSLKEMHDIINEGYPYSHYNDNTYLNYERCMYQRSACPERINKDILKNFYIKHCRNRVYCHLNQILSRHYYTEWILKKTMKYEDFDIYFN